MDAVIVLSVAEYDHLIDGFDCIETIYLGGAWPVSRGRHEDLGEIILGHVENQGVLIRLRCEYAPRPLY